MARGGYRPGGGRPKGSKTKRKSKPRDWMLTPPEVIQSAKDSGMTPLEYMLNVMRDPEADGTRRDRMAIAAAPFCHPRIADNRFGKRDAAAEAARTAGGPETEWGDDLAFEVRPN